MRKKFTKYITIILLIIIFLLILFWAVLSANGYNINIPSLFTKDPVDKEEGLFIQTGGIRINIDDQAIFNEISIYIDGEIKNATENRIENITPGTHDIVISRKDHYDWKSSITIEPTLVTEISPLFFPINPKLESKIPFTLIDKVYFSDYGDYIYYVVSKSNVGSGNGIWKLQLKNVSTLFNNVESEPVKVVNILPELKKSIEEVNYEIIPSPDNKKVLFKTNDNIYYFFEAENTSPNMKSSELVSVQSLLGYTPEYVKWFRGSSSLIIKDNNLLSEFVLSTKREIIISYDPQKQPIFGVNGDSVMVYSNIDNRIYQYKDETKKVLEVENISLPNKIDSLIIDKDNGKFIVFNSEGKYYYLNTLDSYIYKIGENINIIEFSKDGQSLLYEKNSTVYSLVIKEIKPKDEFETSTNIIIKEYNKEKHILRYNNHSSHILILTKEVTDEKDNSTIKVIDRQGENEIILLNNNELREFGKKIIDGTFYMISDNKELVILLQELKFDQNNSEIESNEKHLYSMRLEK